MRTPLLLGLVLAASCYRPKLANPSFFCRATDNPACPDGQLCVDGRCIEPGTMPELGAVDGPVRDQSLADLASSDMSVPPDSSAPPDLMPACVATGGSCYPRRDAVCCSRYCIYSTNKCR
jgi:hypothetical protein